MEETKGKKIYHRVGLLFQIIDFAQYNTDGVQRRDGANPSGKLAKWGSKSPPYPANTKRTTGDDNKERSAHATDSATNGCVDT